MTRGAFVVTTGRSGSTLLSGLLHEHPAVLSLSEFFSSLASATLTAFPRDELSGPELWAVLSTPRAEFNSLMRDCDDGRQLEARGLRVGSIPPLLANTLPLLTPDPAALYEELGAYARSLPRAATGDQYTTVFDWLCRRFGRATWVERSGGSSWFLDDLLRWWPEARYVHLVRDGRDVALSMRDNEGFRLAAHLDELRRERPGVPYSELVAEAMAAARARDLAPSDLGRMWSDQVVRAQERLGALPAARLLVLRYEDLMREPARELERLISFLGAEPDRAWLARAAGRVRERGSPSSRLDAPERDELDAACRPGLRALGYVA